MFGELIHHFGPKDELITAVQPLGFTAQDKLLDASLTDELSLGSLTVEDCEFHDNGNAAIYLYNSNPEISGCDV